jgi:hypothetical protein
MIKARSGPLKGIYQMTGGTILRKSSLNMIRICGCQIGTPVAVDAVNTQNIKPYRIF